MNSVHGIGHLNDLFAKNAVQHELVIYFLVISAKKVKKEKKGEKGTFRVQDNGTKDNMKNIK